MFFWPCLGLSELYTTGGNAYGRTCMFPFLYKNKWYSDCTTFDSSENRLWCAVETKYEHELWGYCPTNCKYCLWEIKFNYTAVNEEYIYSVHSFKCTQMWRLLGYQYQGGINVQLRLHEKNTTFLNASLWYFTAKEHWNKHITTGAYYQLNTESALSWPQAEASCKQQGASLLSITDPHEQAYVTGRVTLTLYLVYW